MNLFLSLLFVFDYGDMDNMQCWGAPRNVVGNHCILHFAFWLHIEAKIMISSHPYSHTIRDAGF